MAATQADKNFSTANVGISAVSSIYGSILQTQAFEAQVKADTEARVANIDNQLASYELNAYKLEEDYALLDSMFADKISERTLQGMKDFATMKAAAAETGTYGGSTAEAVGEAFVNEMFDVALINQQRQSSLGGIMRKSEAAKQNAVNSFKSLASGGMSVKANSLLAGVGTGVGVLGNMLSSMPESVRADMFSMDTTIESDVAREHRIEFAKPL